MRLAIWALVCGGFLGAMAQAAPVSESEARKFLFPARGADLVVSVADNGPGVAPDQVAKIGEPFFRGDPSRTRDTGGTGLGIYIARLVAEAHGGSLRLDQNYTFGARIVVTLREEADETT